MRFLPSHRCLSVATVAILLGGCDWLSALPRDPSGTLDAVRGGTLRAGVIHAPPWVDATAKEPSGLEADILRYLGREFDAELEWVRGGADELLGMLEQHEIHVLIGGFEERSPAMRHVGVTRSYATAEWWVVAREAFPVQETEGREVFVSNGTAAALVRKDGGIPVYTGDDSEAVDLFATPVIAGIQDLPDRAVKKLGKRSYVIAVPPGENAWVVAIDKAVREMPELRAAAAPGDGSAP